MNIALKIALFMDSQAVYYALGHGALLLMLAVSFAPLYPDAFRKRSPRLHRILSRSRLSNSSLAHPLIFFTGLGIALFALRWPLIFIPFALNPDESQGIAQAITILHDPVFYRSVQSGSAGPLWTYPIAIPGLFGLDLTFGTTRFVAQLILWLTCIPVYYAIRPVAGEAGARIATWLALVWFALSDTHDFLHYSSEYPALPLLAAGCLLSVRFLNRPDQRPLLVLFLLGLALGAVPFAKLQGTVIALAIGLFTAAWLMFFSGIESGRKIKLLAGLTAGGITAPAFFSLFFLAFGVFGYFWTVYIVNNLDYKEKGGSFFDVAYDYIANYRLHEETPHTYWFLFIIIPVFTLFRLRRWILAPQPRPARPWPTVLFCTVVLVAAIYAVAAPGRPYPHYFHFLVIPLTLLFGVFLRDPPGDVISPEPKKKSAPKTRKKRRAFHLAIPAIILVLFLKVLAGFSIDLASRSAIFLGFSGVMYLLWRRRDFWFATGIRLGGLCLVLTTALLLLRPVYYTVLGGKYFPPGPGQLTAFHDRNEFIAPSGFINKYKRPGDHLAVWGWYADYYVYTQLPMATRSAVTEFHIRDVPLRDYYRRVYMEEFKKRNPPFFIDAVGPLSLHFKDREEFGFQIFPELAAHIAENYVPVPDFTDEDIVRFFVRKDRAEEILSVMDYMKTFDPPPKNESSPDPPPRIE